MEGKKVIGNWGAMFPYSYGTITKLENDKITINWEDDEDLNESIENVSILKHGNIKEIGIYLA